MSTAPRMSLGAVCLKEAIAQIGNGFNISSKVSTGVNVRLPPRKHICHGFITKIYYQLSEVVILLGTFSHYELVAVTKATP